MNSHLAIKVEGKFLEISPDTSIDIEDNNPYFNDVQETFAYSFQVPVEGNREILGNVDDVQSDNRLVEHENKSMSVIVDGIPLRHGKVATAEDQEIADTITLSMSSNVKSLSDYFADLECRDVPIPEEDKAHLQIGEMIGNVKVNFEANITFEMKSSGKDGFLSWSAKRSSESKGHKEGSVTLELPALGFSVPWICEEDNKHFADGANGSDDTADGRNPTIITDFTNVTEEYPFRKFAHARVCYMHHTKDENGKSTDTVDTSSNGGSDGNGRFNPYFVLEANRPQSGVCFYVLYFLDCLFKYLHQYGIGYDNSELLKVADFKRLVFFTTKCKYDLERKYPNADDTFDYTNIDDINKWLSSRSTGGKLTVRCEESKDIGGISYNGTYYRVGSKLPDQTTLKEAKIKTSNFKSQVQANIMKMYANSDNFPNTSVQSILQSLWASFGIRFFLNQETLQVKPVFIRDIFRDYSAPIQFNGTVIVAHKMNEKITGVRMKYSAESNRKEQEEILHNNVRNYNTDYDYKDYRHITTTETYQKIITHGGLSDLSLWVDLVTGNKYRLKLDGDATKVSEYHPVIFEVGQYNGVEVGDCSDEMEDFVEELSSDFQPVNFNDVNGRTEKTAAVFNDPCIAKNDKTGEEAVFSSVNATHKEQVLAAFVNEDMWHEFCERKVETAFGDDYCDVFLQERCRTKEAFDPNSSDDGISPLQTYDWGTSIAIMRGGGTDARVQYYDFDYDGYGSRKWRMAPGNYGMSSDSIDAWGAEYDYNGTPADGSDNGIGDEDGRFSLKIRSYIEAPYDIPSEGVHKGDILCDAKVARRGLYDTFMSEYAHFLLNRKVVKLEVICEVAELLNIQWTKRYNIGGYVGWINKISTRVSAAEGLEKVIIEMYIL